MKHTLLGSRHGDHVQEADDESDADVQQRGDGVLLLWVHAVLGVHAKVHRDSV